MARPASNPDVRILSREASRSLDRLAVERYAIPPIVLMENAGRHVADIALDGLGETRDASVLIVCGPGNNGGDGLCAARHLHNAGVRVAIVLASHDAFAGESGTNREIVRAMRLPVTPDATNPAGAIARLAAELGGPSLIIDAIFGTGLTRPIEGALADAVRAVNGMQEAGVPVLAIDCPSGLDADTGAVLGACVRADVTVTFEGLKPGFLALDAQAYLGEVIVVDIGAPRELREELGRAAGRPKPEGPGPRVRTTNTPPAPPRHHR